jgi:cytidine deaminase
VKRAEASGRDLRLVRAARAVRARAHAPYSGFKVGAAVRLRDGRTFAGCNVENASLGAAICAERSAMVQAVAAGARPGDLEAVAVYTGDRRLTPPCGMCLQVLVEFGRDADVWLAGPRALRRTRLALLYPEPFTDFPVSRRDG